MRRVQAVAAVLLVAGMAACSPELEPIAERTEAPAVHHTDEAPMSAEVAEDIADEHAPYWDGARWVVDGDIGPDVYGWNCHVDAGGDCGGLPVTAVGCVSDPAGYTMCSDHRVYILQADGSKTDTVWRDR